MDRRGAGRLLPGVICANEIETRGAYDVYTLYIILYVYNVRACSTTTTMTTNG